MTSFATRTARKLTKPGTNKNPVKKKTKAWRAKRNAPEPKTRWKFKESLHVNRAEVIADHRKKMMRKARTRPSLRAGIYLWPTGR